MKTKLMDTEKNLYEILVPTKFELGPKNAIKTRHHKEWDKFVRSIAGGLTLFKPVFGQWVYETKLYEDRVIPVRIACTEKEFKKILKFSLSHYRQITIMGYQISSNVFFVSREDAKN